MDIVDTRDKNKNSREKVCSECKYLRRPYREDLDDYVYCTKLNRFIENIKTYSCDFWGRWTGNLSSLDFL